MRLAEVGVGPAEISPKPVQTMDCQRLSYLQPREPFIATYSNL